jgi:hypothetical protein
MTDDDVIRSRARLANWECELRRIETEPGPDTPTMRERREREIDTLRRLIKAEEGEFRRLRS